MWKIYVVQNDVKITKACAEDLLACEALAYTLEWNSIADVVYKSRILFNSDHFEHMDYLTNPHFMTILKKHKVEGDICFASHEGDNSGKYWGYRFDGNGEVLLLKGTLSYAPE